MLVMSCTGDFCKQETIVYKNNTIKWYLNAPIKKVFYSENVNIKIKKVVDNYISDDLIEAHMVSDIFDIIREHCD